ncbi:MAG: helix-turn-helix domain-containing protein [Solirubrobacteraceae bacterium]
MPPHRQSEPRSAEHAALGEAVRLARVDKGLSQEQLADAAGVHVTHLGGVERGVRNPNYATIVKLARALGVEPGALVTAADELLRRER